MKITDYPSITKLRDNTAFITMGPDETRHITAKDLIESIFELGGEYGYSMPEDLNSYYRFVDKFADATIRNQIYRGKNLGSAITPEQSKEIHDGTFKDMFLGDYWTFPEISGNEPANHAIFYDPETRWIISGFNYYYSRMHYDTTNGYVGQPPELMPNQIILMPDRAFKVLMAGAVIGENKKTVGYRNSKIRDWVKNAVEYYQPNMKKFIDAQCATFSEYESTALSDAYGKPTLQYVAPCKYSVPATDQIFTNIGYTMTNTINVQNSDMEARTRTWVNRPFPICLVKPTALSRDDQVAIGTNQYLLRDLIYGAFGMTGVDYPGQAPRYINSDTCVRVYIALDAHETYEQNYS